MLKPFLFAVALAACGPATPHLDSPISGSAEPTHVAPTTPAPSIAWATDHFALTGLPAIARDRSVVVLPVIEGDGGRGYPNLRIELHSDADRTVESRVVLLSNDYEQLVIDGKPAPPLAKMIDETNKRLAELHREHDLVEMKQTDKLDAHYEKGVLRLVLDGRAASYRRNWEAPPGPATPGLLCENPAYLEHVFYADGIKALVAEIAFKGTDTCWEPGNEMHVVTW
jgi:hypothetical protein